ncbi:hypothetical protein H6P81_020080 [Aristolochia fimbriata]|uniref:Uncharacterized protein n=1 Tax=Aristolochia fimbriata TaxID=158543 RepID=A0AAV7DVB1_ARIFI|nr:hypothetical protein H6P81_020080 [Aristolochia fimbriata]
MAGYCIMSHHPIPASLLVYIHHLFDPNILIALLYSSSTRSQLSRAVHVEGRRSTLSPLEPGGEIGRKRKAVMGTPVLPNIIALKCFTQIILLLNTVTSSKERIWVTCMGLGGRVTDPLCSVFPLHMDPEAAMVTAVIEGEKSLLRLSSSTGSSYVFLIPGCPVESSSCKRQERQERQEWEDCKRRTSSYLQGKEVAVRMCPLISIQAGLQCLNAVQSPGETTVEMTSPEGTLVGSGTRETKVPQTRERGACFRVPDFQLSFIAPICPGSEPIADTNWGGIQAFSSFFKLFKLRATAPIFRIR